MSFMVYSKKTQGNLKVSNNFRVREFACADGSDPVVISLGLVKILQAVRDKFGVPVTINSGYRTPAYNKTVKNASQYSQHIYGRAADIVVKGQKPATVAAFIETLIPNSGGIGVYDDFVHVDDRPTKSRWKG